MKPPTQLPLIAVFLACGMLTSCVTIGPNYKKPVMTDIQDDWHVPEGARAGFDPKNPNRDYSDEAVERWWNEFTDDTLSCLIDQARKANPKVLRGRSRVEEAWAQRNVLRGWYFPGHDFLGDYDIGLGGFSDGLKFDPGEPVYNFAQISQGWSFDVFGKRHRMIESSDRFMESVVEGYRDSYVFFTSSTALYYVNARVAEARIRLSEEKIAKLKEGEDISEMLVRSGLASRINLDEARGRTIQEQANIPRFEQSRAEAIYNLSRICALPPARIEEIMGCGKSSVIPKMPSCISAPLPMQVLRNRPDIQVAERKLAVQVSNIGVAMGNYYPDFNLKGAITYESLFRNGVEDILRHSIGGGPRLRQRIGHGGADRARVNEQKAKLDTAIREYEAVVRQALMEVEIALATIHYTKKQMVAQQAELEIRNKSADDVISGFKEGLVDASNLVRLQDRRFAAAEVLLFSQSTLAKATVALYETVGGGLKAVPSHEPEPIPEVTEQPGNMPLSKLFSLGRDVDNSLHRKRANKKGVKWEYSKKNGIQPAEESRGWMMTSDGLQKTKELEAEENEADAKMFKVPQIFCKEATETCDGPGVKMPFSNLKGPNLSGDGGLASVPGNMVQKTKELIPKPELPSLQLPQRHRDAEVVDRSSGSSIFKKEKPGLGNLKVPKITVPKFSPSTGGGQSVANRNTSVGKRR